MWNKQKDVQHPPVYGFIHIATIGRWKEIVGELFDALAESNLAARSESISICVVGPEASTFRSPLANSEVIYRSDDLAEYEFPTLARLWEFCRASECPAYVYYLHTKGVSSDTPSTSDWRAYMLHFVVGRHADCIAALADCDVCGVNLKKHPWPHLSGNFWWARAEYLGRLPDPKLMTLSGSGNPSNHPRYNCERWVCSSPEARMTGLYDSRVNHYAHRFPASAYAQVTPRPGLVHNRTARVRQSLRDAPVFGFMHVATVGRWREIVAEQFLKLRVSGLWDRMVRLHVGVLGPEAEQFVPEDPKVVVIHRSPELAPAELPTLAYLQQFCRSKDAMVFYIHTKGVTRDTVGTREWRHAMEHFVITRYADCIHALDDHDTCGINWSRSDWCAIYEGNFWWARSDHVRMLPDLVGLECIAGRERSPRFLCERWVAESPIIRPASLFSTSGNHYANDPFPRSRYARVREVTINANSTGPEWVGVENRFQDLIEVVDPLELILAVRPTDLRSLAPFTQAVPDARVVVVDAPSQSRGTWGSMTAAAPNAGIELADERPDLMCDVNADVIAFSHGIERDELVVLAEKWLPGLRPGGCALFLGAALSESPVRGLLSKLPGRTELIESGFGIAAWYKPAGALATVAAEHLR